jgi:transglutaminase-like putative cysteine protease
LGGARSGYVHTVVQETSQNGEKLLRTSVELRLSIKNRNELVSLRMETGSEESPKGKVSGVSMRQYLGAKQQLDMKGTVDGDRLHVKVDGGRKLDQKIPWNDEVIGLYRQSQIFRERRVKPGDQFSYQSYEPTITAVVTTRVAVKDYEEVESPLTKQRQRLLRVEAVPDKIGNVQLPRLVLWLDSEHEVVRSQVDMAPLGTLTLVRTTRQIAMAPASAGPAVDIGFGQTLPTNRRLARPYEADSAVFRITVKGDDDPATTFARDEGQHIEKAEGNSFELHVRARRQPTGAGKSEAAKPEYLQSNYFINSDDAVVRQRAREAAGPTTDDWQRALRIEKWVQDNVRTRGKTDAFGTADHVARTLEGDCTECSVLAAAMCRALNIPSRTATGLVYHVSEGRPVFNYHMWVEVYVKGQWLPLDPTLGRASIGAMHLKINDHSWHEAQSLTPLLPLMRVMGKVSIEVSHVAGDP